MKRFFLLILLLLNSCAKQNSDLIKPQEKNFKSLKQLTFGGDNAEAYWSFDDKKIVFQSNNSKWGLECDQMFYGNFDQSYGDEIPKMVSTGKGRTTCSYFLPNNNIIYASTHEAQEKCPETPLRVDGNYVWPIYESYDIYEADFDGNILRKLTDSPGYDAEATVSPK